MGLINFNGQLYCEHEPVFGILNRSYRYGDGLFETMRWTKGKLNFIEFHLDRLRQGMVLLKYEDQLSINSFFLTQKIAQLVQKNEIKSSASARLTLFRNGAGLYTPEINEIGYSIEVSKLETAPYPYNTSGLKIGLFDQITKPCHVFSNIKSCSALVFILAGIFKKESGLDEVLILNEKGFLCEALSSNLFISYQKKIYTPSLTQGCVAGVMRRVISKLIQKNNFQLIEEAINPEILEEAEEVFFTNAIQGIRWAGSFKKKQYHHQISHFLSDELNKIYSS